MTGTRTARRQQDATVALGVIDAAQLQRSQPQSVAEALRTISGFHAEEGGGEVAVNAFVRGLPSPGGFQYVTLQEHGMPIRSVPDAGAAFSVEDVFFRQDLSVRSVEVAKGGASTLFGANAPGGIINYRSRTGGDVLRSTMEFTIGQTDLYRLDFNSNGPIGNDYRFNVFLPIAHNSQTLEPAIPSDGTHNSSAAADFAVPTPNDGLCRSNMANGVLTRGASVMVDQFQLTRTANNAEQSTIVRISGSAYQERDSTSTDEFRNREAINLFTATDSRKPRIHAVKYEDSC